MKKSFIKSVLLGVGFSTGFFFTAFVFIKAASLTATSGTPLTAGNWNDMVKNFFWGSGSGGIYYNGKVGIGTNSPNKDLHIYDTTNNAEIDLQSVAGTNKHWAIYQDKTNSNLYMWNTTNRVSVTTGGTFTVDGTITATNGLCLAGTCKTNWNQVGSSATLNYTGTCDSAHKGATGIISNVYKLCNGLTWSDIAPAGNFLAGAGTTSDPYRVNGESSSATNVVATSCNYYNLNAITLNNGAIRGSGTCGAGNKECLTSGVYLVDTDGVGGVNAFQVYCDMTSDGGGWSLVMRASQYDTVGNMYWAWAGWTSIGNYLGSGVGTIVKKDFKSAAYDYIKGNSLKIDGYNGTAETNLFISDATCLDGLSLLEKINAVGVAVEVDYTWASVVEPKRCYAKSSNTGMYSFMYPGSSYASDNYLPNGIVFNAYAGTVNAARLASRAGGRDSGVGTLEDTTRGLDVDGGDPNSIHGGINGYTEAIVYVK